MAKSTYQNEDGEDYGLEPKRVVINTPEHGIIAVRTHTDVKHRQGPLLDIFMRTQGCITDNIMRSRGEHITVVTFPAL